MLLLVIGTPLAWWLAQTRWRYKFLLEAVIALPLVLPPTVFRFLSVDWPWVRKVQLGQLLEDFGFRSLAFTFEGLVIGSMIYSFALRRTASAKCFFGIWKATFGGCGNFAGGGLGIAFFPW